MGEVVGTIDTLRRFPVKSMQGERLMSATLGPQGIVGDRALALIDMESGQVVRGKTPHLGPRLLACRAAFTAPPLAGHELPPVAIELPDGQRVHSDSEDADAALTRCFGRPVGLRAVAPPESTFAARRDDFLAELGLPTPGEESFLDALPVSVLTTSTVDRFGASEPGTRFDELRFRMNIIVATTAAGFVENPWPGRRLQLGDSARLRVEVPVPRCVLTTMAQEELPKDPAVLKTVARENSMELGGRTYPCAGVYATVEAAGEIRTHDTVSLVRPYEESPP